MAKPAQIHKGKRPFRRHYLREWLDERDMEPMELLDALNEAASMESPIIDKSQVYRWLKGALPHPPTQIRIAAALELLDPETGEPDPQMLMVHPAQVWMALKIRGRSQDDIERMKQMIDLAFPSRTGTDN